MTLKDLAKLPAGESLPILRRELLRPLLRCWIEAGIKPWIIAQAIAAEAHDFEIAAHDIDPLRELEKRWRHR